MLNAKPPIKLNNPIHFIAVGFGSGLIRPAPGTWGTLLGMLLAIFLWYLTASPLFFTVLTAASFGFGCYICGKTSEDLGVHDDGRIVWDEITAIFALFIALPSHSLSGYLLAFLFFRLFDIAKPYPIRQFDARLQGGFGIMFDDILAALYTLLALHCLAWIF